MATENPSSSTVWLEQALRARYPDMRRIVVSMGTCGVDDELQQSVRFTAPLEVLRRYQLVQDYMLEDRRPARGRWDTTEWGCGYGLYSNRDSGSIPGCFDLFIYSGTTPRDPKRFAVKDAARILKRIARKVTSHG